MRSEKKELEGRDVEVIYLLERGLSRYCLYEPAVVMRMEKWKAGKTNSTVKETQLQGRGQLPGRL